MAGSRSLYMFTMADILDEDNNIGEPICDGSDDDFGMLEEGVEITDINLTITGSSHTRQGAWGDHITLQAIADMLSMKINVFSSNHPMFSVTPGVCSAECEVFLGLILQYHYVGLDKHPVCGVQSTVDVQSNTSDHTDNAVDVQSNTSDHTDNAVDVQSNTSGNTDNVTDVLSGTSGNTEDELLDDATIEEGDEHRRQISGAPMASMMCVENPESTRNVICVAPAEGEKPLNIMTDSNFEAMSNPDKFPFGTGTFSSESPRKLTYRKYFNQRLLDVDGRFARDLDYLFVAQYIVASVKPVCTERQSVFIHEKHTWFTTILPACVL